MFEKFKNVKNQCILVIGDIILDKYIYGDSSRISPEAPVPIVLTENTSVVLGGAANVATNLTALGAKVYLMGCVGNDPNGDLVINFGKGILHDINGIIRSNKITTTKTRIVSKGQQMLRIDDEDVRDISKIAENTLFERISTAVQVDDGITGIVLQDYNKGIFSISLIDKIIELAKKLEIPFFVDPKHNNFWKFKGAALFKPNLSELRQASFADDLDSLDEVLLNSARKLECNILMCTLADKGIVYVEKNKVMYSPTQKIDVIDVSGAGDTSLSIMVLGYLLGYDAKSISILANLCGKIVCMKSGVSTMTLEELETAYLEMNANFAK